MIVSFSKITWTHWQFEFFKGLHSIPRKTNMMWPTVSCRSLWQPCRKAPSTMCFCLWPLASSCSVLHQLVHSFNYICQAKVPQWFTKEGAREEERGGRRESWQVCRCVVSATQWYRGIEENRNASLKKDLKGSLFWQSVLPHKFFTFLSHLEPQSFDTPALSPPACFLFISLSPSPPLSPVSILPSCVLMQQIKHQMCAVTADSYRSTLSSASGSDWNWTK